MAAVAAGADGLMIEVHNNPSCANCYGQQSLTPEQFDRLTEKRWEAMMGIVVENIGRRQRREMNMSKQIPLTISSWTLGDQCTFEERVAAAQKAGFQGYRAACRNVCRRTQRRLDGWGSCWKS